MLPHTYQNLLTFVVKAAYFYFITEFGVFERRHLVVILGIIETKVDFPQ